METAAPFPDVPFILPIFTSPFVALVAALDSRSSNAQPTFVSKISSDLTFSSTLSPTKFDEAVPQMGKRLFVGVEESGYHLPVENRLLQRKCYSRAPLPISGKALRS